MKKVILYSVALLSVLFSISCTADELNVNELKMENTEVNANGDVSITPPKKGG